MKVFTETSQIVGRKSLVTIPEDFKLDSGILLPKDPSLNKQYQKGRIMLASADSNFRVGDEVIYDIVNLTPDIVEYKGVKCYFLPDNLVVLVEKRESELT